MEVFSNQAVYALDSNTEYTSSVIREGFGGGPVSAVLNTAMSDSEGNFAVTLSPDNYDGWYSVEIKSGGATILLDTVSKVRQYASTTSIVSFMNGKVNSSQASEYERIARHEINSIIGTSFSFERKTLGFSGNGTGILVLDERLGGRVFKVTEGEEIVYDDAEATTDFYHGGVSLYTLTMGGSTMEHPNTWSTRYKNPLFKEGLIYRVDAEWGWRVVPQDILDATLLLVNDIACGNNKYSSKYISSFRSATSNVNYTDTVFKGTGNLIVDNILSKYTMESIRAKVL
jgi:hypothetical protein